MRRLYTLLLCLTLPLLLLAQGMSVTVNPRTPYVNSQIEVTYSINGSADGDFKLNGSFGSGVEVLGGPSRGQMSNTTIINGSVHSSHTTTYTYYLLATHGGKVSIPGAQCGNARCGGKTITVYDDSDDDAPIDEDDPWAMMDRMQKQMQQQMQQRMKQIDRIHQQGSGAKTNDNVKVPQGKRTFLSVTTNKTTAYEQEAIVLTYKLYSIDQPINLLRQLNPKFDNFQYKDIEVENDRTLRRETVKGTQYFTTTMYKYVLFPQKSGRLVIPPLHIELETARGFDGVRTNATADSVVFNIKALPERPANFSGAVGHDFKVKAALDNKQVAANDPLNYQLTISGVGNLSLMSPAAVQWPKGFESYDPKKTDNSTISTGGSSGDVLYDFVVVPHNEGDYTVPAASFVYFDTQANAYKTLQTPSFNVHVTPSKDGGRSAEVDDDEESDICGIHKGTAHVSQPEDGLWASLRYVLYYVLLLVVGLIAFVVLWRTTNANMDVQGLLSRRAAKAATKRLRVADRLRRQHKNDEFYDEVMRALLGYVSDKLNIPNTELNKDNVQDSMLSRGVNEQLVKRYLDVLSECEFARFAPGDPDSTVRKIYDDAFNSIIDLDQQLKD